MPLMDQGMTNSNFELGELQLQPVLPHLCERSHTSNRSHSTTPSSRVGTWRETSIPKEATRVMGTSPPDAWSWLMEVFAGEGEWCGRGQVWEQ